MAWGEFTSRMKPMLTTNCSSMVMPMTLMPGVCTTVSTLVTMVIMVEASAVALAKPRWMTIRNSDSSIRMAKALAFCRPRLATMRLASQLAALVLSRAEPS